MSEVIEKNENNEINNDDNMENNDNAINKTNNIEQDNNLQSNGKGNVIKTFDFKREFRRFYDNSVIVEKELKKCQKDLNDLCDVLDKKEIEELYDLVTFKGFFNSMILRWTNSIDIAKKINNFLDGGLSNETLNNLNEFITIAESSKIAKDNFLQFDKDLEAINKKLQDFNKNVKDYEINATMEAIKEENEKIIAFINSVGEKSDELLKNMTDFRQNKIESLHNSTNEIIQEIHHSVNSISDRVKEVESKSVEQLGEFDKNFKDIFENKLVTWKDINIKNYKNFTKFAFGFYVANFLIAVLLGGLAIFMIESKKAYDIQAEELLQANEAYHFLIENGDLKLEKEGDQISLNFVAKQNLTIRQNGQTLQLSIKEKR